MGWGQGRVSFWVLEYLLGSWRSVCTGCIKMRQLTAEPPDLQNQAELPCTAGAYVLWEIGLLCIHF